MQAIIMAAAVALAVLVFLSVVSALIGGLLSMREAGKGHES